MGFEHLERCGDLRREDLEAALESRDACRALLERMAAISAPGTGVAAVLTVFASLASSACGWLDGDLSIELSDRDDVTTVRVMTDLGGGMKENAFRPFELAAPLAELTAAIERTPELLGALQLRKISWRRIMLIANDEERRSTMPPKIGVSDASLWMLERMNDAQKPTATFRSEPPSGDIDESWDDQE